MTSAICWSVSFEAKKGIVSGVGMADVEGEREPSRITKVVGSLLCTDALRVSYFSKETQTDCSLGSISV